MKTEAPLHDLSGYLPGGTLEPVLSYLLRYKVHLTITPERLSVLGDYRQPDYQRGHRISVNGNLNPYEFLLTLLHELAHLIAFAKYGSRIASHGKEWKAVYRRVLQQFIGKDLLPADVELAVMESLHNPAATQCAEESLVRILKKYSHHSKRPLFVEELKTGELFATKDGRVFKRGEKIRKRYRCTEVKTRKVYLFSPIYEVKKVKGY